MRRRRSGGRAPGARRGLRVAGGRTSGRGGGAVGSGEDVIGLVLMVRALLVLLWRKSGTERRRKRGRVRGRRVEEGEGGVVVAHAVLRNMWTRQTGAWWRTVAAQRDTGRPQGVPP